MSGNFSDNLHFEDISESGHLEVLSFIEVLTDSFQAAALSDLISFVDLKVHQCIMNEAKLKVDMVFEYNLNDKTLGSFKPERIDKYIEDIKTSVDDSWSFLMAKTKDYMRDGDKYIKL